MQYLNGAYLSLSSSSPLLPSPPCGIQAQAKFDLNRAREALHWIYDVLGTEQKEIKDPLDFAALLKDGVTLCR